MTTTTTVAIATAHDTFDSTICCRFDTSDAWRRDAPLPFLSAYASPPPFRQNGYEHGVEQLRATSLRRRSSATRIERDPSKDEQRKPRITRERTWQNHRREINALRMVKEDPPSHWMRFDQNQLREYNYYVLIDRNRYRKTTTIREQMNLSLWY